MAINRGKQFEEAVKQAFNKIPDIFFLRLYDTMNGYVTVANPCDFIAFKKPKLFLLECKSCHGPSLPVADISDYQFKSLYQADNDDDDIIAGYLIWFIEKDITVFLRASDMVMYLDETGRRSINYKDAQELGYEIKGEKKRILYEYDMEDFINFYVSD